MPSVGVGEIVQVSFFQTMYAQRILNVVHAHVTEVTGTPDYFTAMQQLADTLAAAFLPAGALNGWISNVTDDIRFNEIRCQTIFPVRLPYCRAIMGADGVLAGGGITPPNTALSVTKRTVEVGRKYVGRVQVAGLDPNMMVNGLFDNVYLGNIEQAFEWLEDEFDDPAAGFKIRWCLFNADDLPPFTDIHQVVAQDTIRTMHRRTVRLGE